MDNKTIWFELCDDEVVAHGHPALDGCRGKQCGDGMVFFYGDGWHNHELYVANIRTCKIRKLSTKKGHLLVDDNEIDYYAIEKECINGVSNAYNKQIRYEQLCRWDDFKGGIGAISWMLYPDGRYFADSGGYGMEDNDEENVYAIMDTNLDFIEPFRPIEDVAAYLKEIREGV